MEVDGSSLSITTALHIGVGGSAQGSYLWGRRFEIRAGVCEEIREGKCGMLVRMSNPACATFGD